MFLKKFVGSLKETHTHTKKNPGKFNVNEKFHFSQCVNNMQINFLHFVTLTLQKLEYLLYTEHISVQTNGILSV